MNTPKTLAEIGAEMLVWIQIANIEKNKVTGLGSEVRSFAEKRVKELLEAARFQST